MSLKCVTRVVAFISSAIIAGCPSTSSGTTENALAATDCGLFARSSGLTPATASAAALMCAGVVPQQPPITFTPYSLTKRRWCSANSAGVSL